MVGEFLIPLGQLSPSQLSVESFFRIMPFKGKVSLTLRGQWQAEEASFKSSTRYHCKLGDGDSVGCTGLAVGTVG